MIYAEVIVKQRTNVEELTYAVPAPMVPYIRSGSLVTVPLRRRVVGAVVIGLRRSVARDLKEKIRPIATIDRSGALSKQRITVLRQLADYYGASLAEVAFHALNAPLQTNHPSQTIRPLQPRFVQGVWSERQRRYVELVVDHPGRSFLFVFAQATLAERFAALVRSSTAKSAFDDTRAKTQQELQRRLIHNESFIVIGTLQRAFFPLKCADFIIVDQPYHVGAKQQQRPFMRAATIARIRGTNEGLQLILGDTLPAVEDIPKFTTKRWQLTGVQRPAKPLTIINRRGARDLLVPGLLQEVSTALQRPGRILVLVLARGWAPALVCPECGHIFSCDNCGRTTAVDHGQFVCRYCHHRQKLPTVCPTCGATNLREVGEGVLRVISELKKLFPTVSVQEFSSDQPHYRRSRITVATEKIFNLPQAQFETVFFLSIDRLLTGAEINDAWSLMGYLLHFQHSAKKIIIQTYFPDHSIWHLAGGGKIRDFFRQELLLRRRYRLPPYAMLFAVVGQGLARKMSEQADQIIHHFLSFFPDIQIGELEMEVVSPAENRARFRVLVPKLTVAQKRALRDFLPPAWHLDVEPVF